MINISSFRRMLLAAILISMILSLLLGVENFRVDFIIFIALFAFVIWTLISLKYEDWRRGNSIKQSTKEDSERRKFLYYSFFGFITLIAVANLPFIEISSKNMIYNGNFKLGLKGWNLPEPNIFTWKMSEDFLYNNEPTLEVQTDSTYVYSYLWSWISSQFIKVEFKHRYKFVTHMAGKNVLASSVVIQPYDSNFRKLDFQLTQVPSGINGTFGFEEFQTIQEIPYGVSYIKVFLLAGLALQKGSPGKTYFADLSMTEVKNLFEY